MHIHANQMELTRRLNWQASWASETSETPYVFSSNKENTMKFSRLTSLLVCSAALIPLGAHAAMDGATRTTFTQECVAAAKKQGLNDKTAATHCECGAKQVDSHLTDKEIASLKDTKAAPPAALTTKLQKLVAENCTATK
ncbi:hypothetical protein ALQ99_00788 [Pseudomonas syringae pv. lapsa]|jgi:hypothetical protein|uniref:Secreted protein n=2 Tax=Pseudomonas syringae TaxID=317 RepID=A0AB73ZZN6_PSESX|nr:hypothetical protein ALQ99_00788 [Pseudomonas syringae pv. lapsa]RML22884.1 hypothetical protein ALQ98_03747 [Pseudomonas syringae pv. lapsa]